MLYSLLLLVAAAGALAWAVSAVVLRATRASGRHALESAEAKWQQQLQQQPGGCVFESFTLGWLNVLLRSLWTPLLEKHVAGLTSELMQKIFNEVLEKDSHKAPWKYISTISVEQLSFGLLPPTFQAAVLRYDPAASLLNVGMDVAFTSNSAQAVILVKTRAMKLLAPLAARLEATHVSFRGRLNLGLALSAEPPGIAGIYYSFASPPHLDIAVRPLGTPLPAEFDGGIAGALQGVLRRIISRRMVEPQRRFFDLHRLYMNKHIARVGGPGGLLRLVINCAKQLSPPAAAQKQQSTQGAAAAGTRASSAGSRRMSEAAAASKAKQSSYCQVRLGQTVLRTPIAHHSAAEDAVWNWQLSLALPLDLAQLATTPPAAAASEATVCSFAVYEAQTVGEPLLLGKTRVSRPARASRVLRCIELLW
ncbi:hypothetical protein OEZ86_011757 [Tetradesmus obliquus]|nr:hypothetical protein OEZ86_011757 [Tetradesmus obliquus]